MKRNGLLVESFKDNKLIVGVTKGDAGVHPHWNMQICVCVWVCVCACVCTWNRFIYIAIYIYVCVCCLYISCNVLVAWSYNNGSQKHCVFPGLASVISKTLQIPRYLQNNGYIQEFYVHLPDTGIELGNFLKISFCKSIMHGFVWAGSYLRCCFSELVNSTRHDLSIQVGSHGFPKGVIILPIIEGSINILKHLDNPNTEVVFLCLLTFQLAVDMACGDWFAALQKKLSL